MIEEQQEATARNARFRQLQRMFVDAATQDVAEMANLLAAAENALPDGDAGRRFRKLAHDLRGTGGGYKFPDISDTAAVLEDQYVEQSSADLLRESLSLLRAAVESAQLALDAGDLATS